ncbi:hypothetical protein KQ306_09095 [Synechococcus sp. CS-1324]|uniref:hypothetical protein n=1 Tax=Synechococcus sp. CS-1324 TaxID=2847980 RepID=UPI00223B8CD7|nr:hypothetical protein [Synechococcus sp. CS-1324]MCT0231003.1 hypothetical protein [Synechococcus sp. CS-1324]
MTKPPRASYTHDHYVYQAKAIVAFFEDIQASRRHFNPDEIKLVAEDIESTTRIANAKISSIAESVRAGVELLKGKHGKYRVTQEYLTCLINEVKSSNTFPVDPLIKLVYAIFKEKWVADSDFHRFMKRNFPHLIQVADRMQVGRD